ARVVEVLRVGLKGRQWFRPAIEILFGALAWLHGEFDAACRHLEAATAGVAVADEHNVDAEPLLVRESIASARGGASLYLALVRWIRGDLTKAEAELGLAERHAQ